MGRVSSLGPRSWRSTTASVCSAVHSVVGYVAISALTSELVVDRVERGEQARERR